MLGVVQAATLGASRRRDTWTPALLNPAHWYDFSDSSTLFTDDGVTPVSADGDLIYRVNNKGSASTVRFVQTDAARRFTYKLNQFNGRAAAVSSDGARDMLSSVGISITAGIFTAVVVFKVPNAASMLFGQGGYSNWLYCAANVQQRWDTSANSTTGAVSTTAAHIITAVYNQANSELYLDGGTDKQANSPGTRTHNGTFQLGANGSSGIKLGATGALCEVFFLPGVVISASDRAALQGHLSTKWGIPIT